METPVRTGPFPAKPRHKPRHKPRQASRARGRNPRTKHPPNPPQGGRSADQLLVEETYRTARGRNRRRLVAVDPDAVRSNLQAPAATDRRDWATARELLRERVGQSTFEIWLEPVDVIAVDKDSALVLSAPTETVGWIRGRFGRQLAACATEVGRQLRFAHAAEIAAVAVVHADSATPGFEINHEQQEVS